MIDKRVKIPKELHLVIVFKYIHDRLTKTEIAKHYGVSRRTIDFIINPWKLEKVKQQAKDRRQKHSYTKEQRRIYQREYRERKKEVKE